MSKNYTPPTLSSNSMFAAYTDDDYNKDKTDSNYSHYDPKNNDDGLIEKSSLDKDYNCGNKNGNEDQDYGSLQVGSQSWLMAYDGQNYTGSLRLFHNQNISDLDDCDRAEGVDTGTAEMSYDNKWDNAIRSWRLSKTRLYDTNAITSDFLKLYAPYGDGSGGVKSLDNGKGSFSNIPDTDDWAFPDTQNRYINTFQSHSKFRIFWPFMIQTGDVMEVWLEIENQNTLDNGVAYVNYKLDLKQGILIDEYKITYHAPTPPPHADFWYKVTEGVILLGSAAIIEVGELFYDIVSVYEGIDPSATDVVMQSSVSQIMTALGQVWNSDPSLTSALDIKDDGAIHFSKIVSHAILRSANAILTHVAENCNSGESVLYDLKNNTDTLTLDMDSLPSNLLDDQNAVWDTSTWNANVELQLAKGEVSVDGDRDYCPYRVYMPEWSAMLNKTGIFCSFIVEALENSDEDEAVGNNHASVGAVFNGKGEVVALQLVMNNRDTSTDPTEYSTITTGLVTYDSEGNPVQVKMDSDGNVITPMPVADPSFNKDLIAYFASVFNDELEGNYGTDNPFLEYYAEAINNVLEAIQDSINR